MATKCRAGECEIECGVGGCGCIAESDNPDICTCKCFKDGLTNDIKIQPTTPVDVSINDLTLFDAATLLNGVLAETVVGPMDKMAGTVSLNLKRTTIADVLSQLGLTTRESVQRRNRTIAILMFLAGFAVAALLFALVL